MGRRHVVAEERENMTAGKEKIFFDKKDLGRIHLTRLRAQGFSRFMDYEYRNHVPRQPWMSTRDFGSQSFLWTWLGPTATPGVYVDLCCGLSPDRLVAQQLGYKVCGIDIAPINPYPQGWHFHESGWKKLQSSFVLGDVEEKLPFADNSVIAMTCHAAIDLIKPVKRQDLYAEISRCLKPEGVFALTHQKLCNGYGWDGNAEIDKLKEVGFIKNFGDSGGWRALKP